MAGRKHAAEQIVAILRQIEDALSNSETNPPTCREAGITEQTYYRWRKEYGGLKLDQARRLKLLPARSTPINTRNINVDSAKGSNRPRVLHTAKDDQTDAFVLPLSSSRVDWHKSERTDISEHCPC